MISGIDVAERLVGQLVADPAAVRCVGITGPGGCGKSALLSSLAASYCEGGIEVVDAHTLRQGVAPDTAVFLDDAHLAEPSVLDRVRPLVTAQRAHLFVALRPWPSRPELSMLMEAIRQRGQMVRLDHLPRDAVERRASTALEVHPTSTMVDVLYAKTGGLPLLVDEVVNAWRHDVRALGGPVPVIPAAVVDRLQQLVDGADVAVRAVLQAVAIGCELEPETVSTVLGIHLDEATDAVAAARATGFLLADGSLVPLVAAAVLHTAPPELTRTMRSRLLHLRHRQRRDIVPLAKEIARTGVHDGFVADVLSSAGDRLRPSDPACALELYDAAIDVGASISALALRRAESAARDGRFDLALQVVDAVLADPDGREFAAGVEIAATVMAHRGQLERAAELYEWLGPERVGTGTAMAVIALLATGRADKAALLSWGGPEPTLAGGARDLMARGLRASIDGDPAAALSTLMRATGLLEAAERSALLPDSPAALAALIAIHTGDLDFAESALTRAIEQDLGGRASWARHRLLQAWVAMLRGHYGRATRLRTEATEDAPPSLRDEAFVRALDVGVARRTSDVAGLVAAWNAGHDVLLRHPVDLFGLLPLGEFSIAAARLRQSERVHPHLEDAWSMLHRLGDPFVWTPTLHWCGVQAAILRNRPDVVEPHAAALVSSAQHSPLAAALAAAGRAWMQVLAGDVVPHSIEPTARRLQEFGLAWDGSRLLGQAAARSSDRQAIAALLQAARSLQQPDDVLTDTDVRSGSSSRSSPSRTVLSGREQEVADLLLQRRTYREIGQQLFISPKTVEHHVARMKQRLGATGRADLLTRLRAEALAER